MTPKVTINQDVYRKIMFWVNKAEGEVSGLGTVIFDKDKKAFAVKSAMLLPQKNASASTDIDSDAICKAMYDMRLEEGELRFWWHSHVNMGVFWSGTDQDTIKQIGGKGWVVASVFNKKAEAKTCYYSEDHLFPVFVDNLALEMAGDEAIKEEWVKEYEACCKREYPTYPLISSYGQGEMVQRNTGNAGNNVTDITDTEIEMYIRNNQRPPWLTKREWKLAKREYRNALDMEEMVDANNAYPFSQDEMSKLASFGVDIIEIDYMLNHGYSKEDILGLINDPYDKLNDDDIPVMDRRYQ